MFVCLDFWLSWDGGPMFFVVGMGCKRRLTALLDCRAFLGELDEYDVAEAFLRIVRDGHRPNSTLVVKRDQLVI